MPRGDVALGDRHEARKARLGGEQVVAARVEIAPRDPITEREELAVRVEQKAELHRVGHGPRRRLERRQAPFQGAGGVGGLCKVTAVTLDRPLRRLRPEQHFGAGVVATFAGQRSGDVDHGRGLRRDFHQSCSELLRRQSVLAERGGQRIERIAKLMPRDRLRPPVVGKSLQGFAREIQAVFDAGN